MREASVIIPAAYGSDAEAAFQVHAQFKALVARRFGGVTVVAGHGADPVEPAGEDVFIYTVAMADTHDNDAALLQFALAAWSALDQQFGYIRLASGDVEIIDVRKALKHGLVRIPSGLVPASPDVTPTTQAVQSI